MEKQFGVLSKKNNIFQLATESKHLPNVVVAIILAIVIMFGTQIFSIVPLIFLSGLWTPTGLMGEALSFAVAYLIIPFGMTILGFFAWVKFREKRSIRTMGFEQNRAVHKYLRGFGLGVGMMGLCVLILVVSGQVTLDMSNPSVTGFSALGGILIVLMGWMIQGASEEIMVRGWLLPVIGARHNVALGIFISSVLFGALHLFNDSVSALPIVNLILFGGFAALYVIWEGGLWGVCAVHSAWNWAQGNLFGFEVSGNVPPGGMLMDFQPNVGQELLTGGLFGIEGGLVCSFVLGAGICILLFLINKDRQETVNTES